MEETIGRGGCSQCRDPEIDRVLNHDFVDPCERKCERDCQDEPCVRYGCPVSLYDKCVFYSGGELCKYGIKEGDDLSKVIDVIGRMLVSRDRQIELYQEEVLGLRKIVNELANALMKDDVADDNEEEDLW